MRETFRQILQFCFCGRILLTPIKPNRMSDQTYLSNFRMMGKNDLANIK